MAYSVAALKLLKPRYAAAIMLTYYRFFLLKAVLILMLAACGQRGPLYLPDENSPPLVPRQTGQQPPEQPAVRSDSPGKGFEDETGSGEEDPDSELEDGR